MSRKGMTEEQKKILTDALDAFKQHNGGCILCGDKIREYNTAPVSCLNGAIDLHIYGVCLKHSVLVTSDRKIISKVRNMKRLAEHPAPTLVTVSYGPRGDEVMYSGEDE